MSGRQVFCLVVLLLWTYGVAFMVGKIVGCRDCQQAILTHSEQSR